MDTPVAFIVFNRPQPTKLVLDAIRQAQPKQLYVIADGPRPDSPTDKERCAAVRAIIETVDWDCHVHRNYAEKNMGCRDRVSSGITWLLSAVPEAIILEDDCIPDQSFFPFCEALLDKYRDDERIMQIGGYNPLSAWDASGDAYFFSLYGSNWGWATWSRAWNYYDVSMTKWLEPKTRQCLRDVIDDDAQYRRRSRINWKTYRDENNTWDFQWTFARMLQSGLAIVPASNLVRNVGFGSESTHFQASTKPSYSDLVTPITFPLQHPYCVTPDRAFDHRVDKLRHELKFNDYVRYTLNRVRRAL